MGRHGADAASPGAGGHVLGAAGDSGGRGLVDDYGTGNRQPLASRGRIGCNVLRTGDTRLKVHLSIRRQQCQGEVMIDMRVHPCQSKLNTIDPRRITCTQHRIP